MKLIWKNSEESLQMLPQHLALFQANAIILHLFIIRSECPIQLSWQMYLFYTFFKKKNERMMISSFLILFMKVRQSQ